MPKRDDLKRILIIGSGPIVIGQACEFDYSGTQACKALLSDGYEVVLVNSNPATIMTDPGLSTRTYIEPLIKEYVAEIIAKERPDALLPTVGGQTGLNLSVELAEAGVLNDYGVELIGANLQAIRVAEDRRQFRSAIEEIGLEVPRSGFANNMKEAHQIAREVGLPAVVRPSYTLGGSGGGIAFNSEEFEEIVGRGLHLSPIHEVLIEESVLGWKEFELEVMRDLNDNVVIICSIENIDPMGVHTGDSVTVAPAQTLTDREYQAMRDASLRIIRRVGVETGGSNIQFAVDPESGRMVVIEMNPRVSRSSALASKATGFPIAKIAAKLAVGYTLDELPNDITLKTPASFEPTLDYVVVKFPRWNFKKFRGAEDTLGTQMKSVGEAMSIGRTFREAFLKSLRSLEIDNTLAYEQLDSEQLRNRLVRPNSERMFYLRLAFARGMSLEEIHRLTRIDPWFLEQMRQCVRFEQSLAGRSLDDLGPELLAKAKQEGVSDLRLAQVLAARHGQPLDEIDLWKYRRQKGLLPVFKRVDTCAAEFESYTPYLYSTYESEDESGADDEKKVVILGSGPNRIGQGIEFDYCCCHAVFALDEKGYETIMVNCNPETVSTDYDTSDRLYFEPLTFEDVMAIMENEKPEGVIVQFGGQTPLKLAQDLARNGVPIIGTSPDSIDLAEDRKLFGNLLRECDIPQPDAGTALSLEEAREIALRLGFPVLVRPSYVLGGRAMAIIYDEESLEAYFDSAVDVSAKRPVLVDRFLENAVEFDVDAVSDGETTVIGGILEHIEEAGIHSGDSTMVLPPIGVAREHLETIKRYTRRLAEALKVIGLMNIQYALADGKIYVIEVNPRASRTVPFVSKAAGIPLAKLAARVMAGEKLSELGLTDDIEYRDAFFVKAPVFPFNKFPGVDTSLGPEMRSTGEVMGADQTFGEAYFKAKAAAGQVLPRSGTVFISVNQRDKEFVGEVGKGFQDLGFDIVATHGTHLALREAGVESREVFKVNEGRPNIVDLIRSNKIDLVVNTPLGRASFYDEKAIQRACISYDLTSISTIAAAKAAVEAIRAFQRGQIRVKSLQEYHAQR
ncbi:MAG TPA: carbamoyl-phosphate synthase large subunit [Acidobacteriota bacterium]|nr:carbamoyl-phosphate synthase large subunit [Acidobacteriota bacterium]